MKILHLDTQKGFRGGEQQLIYLALGLRELGVDSIIACCDELSKKARTLGFETIDSKNFYKLLNAARKCDILHAHASNAHTLGVVLKLLTKKPLVYTRRVDYKQKKTSKIKYMLTDKAVSVSNAVKQVLYINYRTFTEVIYDVVDFSLLNQVDPQKVEAIKKKYKYPIIGNIGALTEQKDHKTLIDAASLLDKTYTFLILGKGELKEELENYAKQKGVDNVVFLGFRQDIQNYLAAFDLFVISSQNEGLCSSILQAFLFKIPTVATDAGGIIELIGNNQRGLIVPIKDAKGLALAIDKLISNTELSKKLVNEAYEFAKDFNYKIMSQKYLDIYKKHAFMRV
ncbi:Glycosyltransferase [Desulfurella amilsii]|uniref:Glycosyltransferase n=1 Tax=Desulfurella amilsii TaxID=1562698 RepID=A0A1X4XUT8_9BACT|nr:glycosyltransferase family 4 protein [Desulfurella amilsii]OSS41295.1 Glycosyltransferase [Desulfurella amilsii]